jgi:hypothetical protein
VRLLRSAISAPSTQLESIGARSSTALFHGQPWLLQRSVALIPGRQATRIEVNVDFRIPAGLPFTRSGVQRLYYLPVSFLPKWPPVFGLELRVAGAIATVPPPDQNARVDYACLLALLKTSLGDEVAQKLSGASRDLVYGQPPAATQGSAAISQAAGNEPGDHRDTLVALAAAIRRHRILWLPVHGSPGDHQQASYSYEARFETLSLNAFRVLARGLAWGVADDYYEVPVSLQSSNHHLELIAPDGLRITDMNLYLLLDKDDRDSRVPSVYVERLGGTARVFVQTMPQTPALIRARILPTWPGFPVAAWVIALSIAGLLTAFWRWSTHLITDPTSAVAVLLIVPAVIGIVVLRPISPPASLDRVIGFQLLLALVGALVVFSAVAGVRFEHDPATARMLWRTCAYVAYVALSLITVSVGVGMREARRARR